MRLTPRTETDAQRASRRVLLPAGWHNARVVEAVEKPSKRGNDMIEITVIVPDTDGNERTFRDLGRLSKTRPWPRHKNESKTGRDFEIREVRASIAQE